MSEPGSPQKTLAADDQARIVARILREYGDKLSVLATELLTFARGSHSNTHERAAWFLDQSEYLQKPLLVILSRASNFVEHGGVDSLIEDELRLRLIETEIHLHHVLRLAHELRSHNDQHKMTADVAQLRMAAGLSGMKGGPLRPN